MFRNLVANKGHIYKGGGFQLLEGPSQGVCNYGIQSKGLTIVFRKLVSDEACIHMSFKSYSMFSITGSSWALSLHLVL